MPLFLLLFGLVAGAYALGARRATKQLTAQVGAEPKRPPRAFRGDYVFSLPQHRWGRVECLANAPSGCRYGVRFPSGNAVVLSEHELTR